MVSVHKIEADDLKELNIEKDDFVLFKTRNSNVEHFDFEFVYVTESAAKYLAEKQIKGVGVDGSPVRAVLLETI